MGGHHAAGDHSRTLCPQHRDRDRRSRHIPGTAQAGRHHSHEGGFLGAGNAKETVPYPSKTTQSEARWQDVKTRNTKGTDLHYVEGWHVIAEAHRIFGYDAWDRRTLASHCVWSGQSGAYYGAAYTAKVRVNVRAGDITIVREGSGTGEGTAPTPGQAHEPQRRRDRRHQASSSHLRQPLWSCSL
jgi:Rad52/22 family double-strand break repair protein